MISIRVRSRFMDRAGSWNAAEKRFVPQLTVSISSSPYLFVSPGDVATIYNAPTSLNTHLKPGQATYDGTGVTIGDCDQWRREYSRGAELPFAVQAAADTDLGSDGWKFSRQRE